MNDYKVYSNEIILNDVLFQGMDRREMESTILMMLSKNDFSVFKVVVDVLYLMHPTIKNTIKVRVFRRVRG